LEKGNLYVSFVVKIPTLKCIVFKIQDIFQTMSRKFGERFVKNVSKEKSGEVDLNSSQWTSELDFIYINRKTGEKRLK